MANASEIEDLLQDLTLKQGEVNDLGRQLAGARDRIEQLQSQLVDMEGRLRKQRAEIRGLEAALIVSRSHLLEIHRGVGNPQLKKAHESEGPLKHYHKPGRDNHETS